MSLDVQNERTQTYYSLKGDLAVQWEADRMAARTIETQQLRVLARQGKPVFRKKIEFDREDDVVPYLPMLMTLGPEP